MADADKVLRDIVEIKALRAALGAANEYQPGRVRVAVSFRQPIKQQSVRREIDKAALGVIKDALSTAEMRNRISARIAARIAVLEARYPGLVD